MTPFRALLAHPLILSILTTWPGATLMSELSENEVAAMSAAGDAGGAFLDKLGKTDLATLDENEWMSFVEVLVQGFRSRFAILMGPIDRDVPF